MGAHSEPTAAIEEVEWLAQLARPRESRLTAAAHLIEIEKGGQKPVACVAPLAVAPGVLTGVKKVVICIRMPSGVSGGVGVAGRWTGQGAMTRGDDTWR